MIPGLNSNFNWFLLDHYISCPEDDNKSTTNLTIKDHKIILIDMVRPC